jgi:Flp pilus assembly protein CpaB
MTGGKVTSLEMTEIKWVTADLNQTASVKEQRVDGSSASDKGAVRCTLVAGKPVLEIKVYFRGERSSRQVRFEDARKPLHY